MHCLLCFLLLCIFTIETAAQQREALYLRDGSVIDGTVFEGTLGDYLVYNSLFGQVTINSQDIVYRELNHAGLRDAYLIIEDSLDVVSVMNREIPEPTSGSAAFQLLIPGEVLAVSDPQENTIFYKAKSVGDSSLLTIARADLPSGEKQLRIVTRQRALLHEDEGRNLCLKLKYVLAQDGKIRVLVKYPATFRSVSAKPQPTEQFDQLLVWETELQRQRVFAPEIVFAKNAE